MIVFLFLELKFEFAQLIFLIPKICLQFCIVFIIILYVIVIIRNHNLFKYVSEDRHDYFIICIIKINNKYITNFFQ